MKRPDHLDSNAKKRPNKNKSHKKTNRNDLSRREIEELMGIHRETFERVRGKIRRR